MLGNSKRRKIENNQSLIVKKLHDILRSGLPKMPPQKIFKPKQPNVKILANYSTFPGPDFWKTGVGMGNFPSNRNIHGKSPFKMNADEIEELANRVDLPAKRLVKEVCNDIRHGCDLKVDANKCKPTVSKNAPSAIKDGMKVTDALADWVASGIAAGPFKSAPKNCVVNSIQTATKPNGSVRIIVNNSSPKVRSVNDCLDEKAYPSKMGGTKELLRALNWWGRGAEMFKVDWNSAYKHLWVREKDLRYQWLSLLGMFFLELCLIFGCVSSVGLYDRAARLVVMLAVAWSGFPWWSAVQHLDDLCAVGPPGDGILKELYETYLWICKRINVSLANTDDPDKAFAPTTCGTMLGIVFDTKLWIWYLSDSKISRYVNEIDRLRKANTMDMRFVKSVVGKIMYVKPLIPGAKFHVSELIKLDNLSKDLNEIVSVGSSAKDQLDWWFAMIQLCKGMPIPSEYDEIPRWAIACDTDAAGGVPGCTDGRGVGAVSYTHLTLPTKRIV